MGALFSLYNLQVIATHLDGRHSGRYEVVPHVILIYSFMMMRGGEHFLCVC